MLGDKGLQDASRFLSCGSDDRLQASTPTPLGEINMVARGRVHQGVVVLEEGVRFPEGQEVTVLAFEAPKEAAQGHSILDIPPVSVGAVLRPLSGDDDLLGEMLEGRP